MRTELPVAPESVEWKAFGYGSAVLAITGLLYVYFPVFIHKPVLDQGRIAYFFFPSLLRVVISSLRSKVAPLRVGIVRKSENPKTYWFMVIFYILLLTLDIGYIGYRLMDNTNHLTSKDNAMFTGATINEPLSNEPEKHEETKESIKKSLEASGFSEIAKDLLCIRGMKLKDIKATLPKYNLKHLTDSPNTSDFNRTLFTENKKMRVLATFVSRKDDTTDDNAIVDVTVVLYP